MAIRESERGQILAALMVAVAVLLILSTVTMQAWADRIRRDDEAEMIFRAQEIVRAIRKFQKDQGRLPTELKELVDPGQKRQYFLRRLYEDPLVKDGKWGLLYLAPGGGIVDPNSAAEQMPEGIGDVSMSPTTPMATGLGAQTGAAGGTEIGGLPIAGVRTLCKDKPFRVLNDQTSYEDWTFTILDLDKIRPGAPGAGADPGGGKGRPGGPGRSRGLERTRR